MRGTKLIVDCFVLRDGLKKLQIIKCVSQYNWVLKCIYFLCMVFRRFDSSASTGIHPVFDLSTVQNVTCSVFHRSMHSAWPNFCACFVLRQWRRIESHCKWRAVHLIQIKKNPMYSCSLLICNVQGFYDSVMWSWFTTSLLGLLTEYGIFLCFGVKSEKSTRLN